MIRRIVFSIVFACIIALFRMNKAVYKADINKPPGNQNYSNSFEVKSERSLQDIPKSTRSVVTQLKTAITQTTATRIVITNTSSSMNNVKPEITTVENVTSINTEVKTTELGELFTINEDAEVPNQNDLQTENILDVENAIIIHNKIIEVFCGPATQENTDQYDVVQDNECISDYLSTFFFGHVTGSFSCLRGVEVGEKIILVNNGIKNEYVVTKSEKAEVITFYIQRF